MAELCGNGFEHCLPQIRPQILRCWAARDDFFACLDQGDGQMGPEVPFGLRRIEGFGLESAFMTS